MAKVFQNLPQSSEEANHTDSNRGMWWVGRLHRWKRRDKGTSLGFIAQEPEGKVLASATKLIETNLQPREAEAFALRWAIILCARLLLPEVAFETDCLKLVQQ